MNVLGVKIRGHDTGAALISDGRIVAIAEERLNRVKHSFEMFPELSIPYCLKALGVKPEEVDLVVMDQASGRWLVPIKQIFLDRVGTQFRRTRIEVINHHDAHAASAFFCSPFDEAAILVYDGAGERYKSHLGVSAIETESLYRGEGNQIHLIQKTLHLRDGKSCPYTMGIGKLYSELSAYIGFQKYEEGKMMGLAPYGNDSILKKIAPERWFCEKEGHVVCNSQIVYSRGPLSARVQRRKSLLDFYTVTKSFLRMRSKKIFRPLLFKLLDKIYSSEVFIEPALFPPIRLPRPMRPLSHLLPDEYYASVAYAGQKILEMVAHRLGKKLKGITGSENLCVAGGCGLNIDANKKFLDDVGFKRLFIQPAASDTGCPLGSALFGWHVILNRPRFLVMRSAELGRKYQEEEIHRALEKHDRDIVIARPPNLAQNVARLIADGNIIGWFSGGSEYGPRALGHRSILCDARSPRMKDIVNNKVKHREPWRPFAASVLKEYMRQWFELDEESPFMLLAAPVVEAKRKLVPSVVHVDGTCRIQSLTREVNGRYYDLISAFNKLTGVPLILNTSFNLAGEPIIETPDDALNCFLKTKMDYLVLENYLVSKKA